MGEGKALLWEDRLMPVPEKLFESARYTQKSIDFLGPVVSDEDLAERCSKAEEFILTEFSQALQGIGQQELSDSEREIIGKYARWLVESFWRMLQHNYQDTVWNITVDESKKGRLRLSHLTLFLRETF